jgi:succinate dehydrogenase/fumarate reductase flavoprotein subunit
LLRFAYDRAEDLLPLVPDVEQQVPGFITGVEPYPHKRFREDLDRVLDAPPFTAWPVTGGITFTFGGVKVDAQAQVQSTSWTPIPGLYACGEMVGGLFHGNYPGGTGLTSGAVFGRIAGASAAGA